MILPTRDRRRAQVGLSFLVAVYALLFATHQLSFAAYRIDLDVYRIGPRVWLSGGEVYGPLRLLVRLAFGGLPPAAVSLRWWFRHGGERELGSSWIEQGIASAYVGYALFVLVALAARQGRGRTTDDVGGLRQAALRAKVEPAKLSYVEPGSGNRLIGVTVEVTTARQP